MIFGINTLDGGKPSGAVDVAVAIGDRTAVNRGSKMRFRAAVISAVLVGILSLLAPAAEAQTNSQGTRAAQAAPPADPLFAPSLRRPSRRVFIYPQRHFEPDVYPRYFPGPNAVRVCNATYVQEYRPSGTVIVPRMSCVWRPG